MSLLPDNLVEAALVKTGMHMSANGIHTILFSALGEGDRHLAPRASRQTDVDIALGYDYAAAVRNALQLSRDDTATVEAARREIEQGRLDTLPNIQTAAEMILTFGI